MFANLMTDVPLLKDWDCLKSYLIDLHAEYGQIDIINSVLMTIPSLHLIPKILNLFGADVDEEDTCIHSPLVIHNRVTNYDYSNLKICRSVNINPGCFIDISAKITFEPRVSIGPNTFFLSHNGFRRNELLEKKLAHMVYCKPITVREGANIKMSCNVIAGVTIGENSVIGANSTVTRNIREFSFALGNPAKVIYDIRDK